MLDADLLKRVRGITNKEAYAPPAPDPSAAGMPMTDPAMAAAAAAGGAGGGMPMDPAMMAGGGMPMDPAMMAGGGAPAGVDPMTGLPPMDPAAMGGMPMDPSMMGMPPAPEGGGETVQVSLDDLRAIFKEVAGGGGEAPAEGGGSVEERLGTLEEMMGLLLQQFGLIPEEGMAEEPAPPMGAEAAMPPAAEAAPPAPEAEAPVQGLPQDFSLLESPDEIAVPEQKQAAGNSEFVKRLRDALSA